MAILDPRAYDYTSFTLATGQSDYDVKDDNADLFLNVPNAGYLMIKSTYAISVKVNSTSNPALPVAQNVALELGKYKLPIRGIDNIYITNASGSEATIEVRLAAGDEGVSTSN